MRLISSARICIATPDVSGPLERGLLQFVAQPLELRPEAAVPDHAAHLGDQAADDLRVGLGLELDLAAGGGVKRVADPPLVPARERQRAGGPPAPAAGLFVEPGAGLA